MMIRMMNVEDAAVARSIVQVVFEDAMGFCRSQMLATACKLDVATILGDGGRNTSALALATHSDEGRLFRLMRALAAIGYFQLSDNSWFNTALSSCLRENHPNYVCPMIGHLVEDSQPAVSVIATYMRVHRVNR